LIAAVGGLFLGTTEKINRNIKTVVVAVGGGNQDNRTIANETWGAGYVLFSKTGHTEKAKPVKAVQDQGCRRIFPPQSPHAPQARRKPMSISGTGCAKLIPGQ
jgi:hypothetical protein